MTDVPQDGSDAAAKQGGEVEQVYQNGKRHLWKPGQSGNPLGRPHGSRHRLVDAFTSDLQQLWEREGAAALERLAADDPASFVKVVASLVPRDLKLTAELRTVVLDFRGVEDSLADPIADDGEVIDAELVENQALADDPEPGE